jgi:aconitate hydratase
MGVLPLQFVEGENAESLGLQGDETIEITGISKLSPNKRLTVTASRRDGTSIIFQTIARLDSLVELEYYENGGILNKVLRSFLS